MPGRTWIFRHLWCVAIVFVMLFALQLTSPSTGHAQAASSLPRPAHIVVVMEENHGFSQIIGSSGAPYINSLAKKGALFTNSHGITHPSEPNYLGLFSGSTQGVTSDVCPVNFSKPNLGSELSTASDSFVGYSESLPQAGFTGCFAPGSSSDMYARKHNPWVDFSNLPASVNQPFTTFPTNFSTLPTVSIVVPNEQDDMHSGSVQQGDTWLKDHINNYVQWAQNNNSLLIVTWDEDNDTAANHIPTIFVGPMVRTGNFSEKINHYTVLRTLEALYALPFLGNATKATTITDIWK